ncbi:hypothetical protein BDV23DRAFT_181240 [Aspergillus alliaceus]|uniref:Uncharacterized protein n=1 Tax=Petromyces alliaceus TaxID=209559 RepID=A0A5N7CH37_PETAA|nr:hypothetical protein BDV23DRAFT_181240 [Aspergillus alliaceus]
MRSNKTSSTVMPEPDFINPVYTIICNTPSIAPFTPVPPIHISSNSQIQDRLDFAVSLLSHPLYNPQLQTRLPLEEYQTLCNALLHPQPSNPASTSKQNSTP